MLSTIIVLALIFGAELWWLCRLGVVIMAEGFGEIGSWPGRGDWRGRAERIAEWDGATRWEKKFACDIATEHKLTPKQMHKLMTIWRQYLKATPVPGKARQR